MTIKWYGLAELLGLVQNISYQYNDGGVYWRVAANADDVFLSIMLSLIPVMFFLGYLTHFICRVKQNPMRGEKMVLTGSIVLLVYAILLAAGVGPYIQFYPQSGGFLDLSTLSHIVDGIYTALLALMLWLGSFADKKMGNRRNAQKN